MSATRIRTGDKEPIEALIVGITGSFLTGLTDIKVRIRRTSDDLFYDWSDDTFKAVPVQPLQTLVEIDAVNEPGRYKLNAGLHVNGFNTAAVTNPTAPAIGDTYVFMVIQDGGTTAKNVPLAGELTVGQYVDSLDAAVSSRASAAALATAQADLDDIQVRLPATLNAGRMRAHVEALSAGVITATEAPALANLDAAVSSRAAAGDAMTLTPGERTAVGVAVRDTPLAGAAAGSIGLALRLLMGVAGKSNTRMDNFVYNVNGFLTSARLRVFPDQATTAASTAGGTGEGEILTVTLTGAPDGTFVTLPSTVVGLLP